MRCRHLKVLLLTSSALLLAAGFGLSDGQIVGFLDPSADPLRITVLHEGAFVFRALLVTDAVVLLLLLTPARQLLAMAARNAGGLWRPDISPDRDTGLDVTFLAAQAAVLLLALLLRILSLNTDLWIDEVFTLVNYVRLPLGSLVTNFTDDNQHLFFSVLAHISTRLFGESPWAVRLPAMLFGIASIWAAMRLAVLVFDKRVAVFTGLLLAVSWHHIWFSQNARGYTILLFGTLFSTDLLLRALHSGQWRFWTGYALVIALTAWAHVTAVFVALAHGLVILLLLARTGRLRTALWMPAAGLLLAAWFTVHLYALVIPQMLEFFSRPGGGTGVTPVEWRNPLWLFNEIFQRVGVPTAFGWTGVAATLLVLVLLAWWYLRRKPLFVALAVMPGLLLGVTMYLLGRNLWPRMFFNEAGFVIMLLVFGLLAAGDSLMRRYTGNAGGVAATLPVLLLVAVSALTLPGLYRHPKQDFTGARDFVRERLAPGDSVVGLHVTGRVYNQYYAPEWPEVSSLQELQQYQSARGNTWVLYTLPNYIRAVMPDLFRVVEEQYELVKVFPGTLGDGDIIVRRHHSPQQE